jgi:hypothetical protein
MAKNLIPNILYDSKVSKSLTPFDSSTNIGTQRKIYTHNEEVFLGKVFSPNDNVKLDSLLADEVSFFIINGDSAILNVCSVTFQGSSLYSDTNAPVFLTAGEKSNLQETIIPFKNFSLSTSIFGYYDNPQTEYISTPDSNEVYFSITDTNNYYVQTGNTVINTVAFWS